MKTYYAIESFYGGSHKQWLDQLKEQFSHHFDTHLELFTLPARNWKWRHHGAAISLAENIKKHFLETKDLPECILVTDIIDLALLKSLLPNELHKVPIFLYFHENQFAYPQSDNDSFQKDQQYAFMNYTSALIADKCFFNSHYNKDSFLFGAQKLLKRMPDHQNLSNLKIIKEKSQVLPIGLSLNQSKLHLDKFKNISEEVRILWNHRWEHDKNPEDFFKFLYRLIENKTPIKVCLAGQRTSRVPECFYQFIKKFPDKVKSSEILSRSEYEKALDWAHFSPNTSTQDFFGISLMESMSRGVIPLLPSRLAFPEHFQGTELAELLFFNDEKLIDEVFNHIQLEDLSKVSMECSNIANRYEWNNLRPLYKKTLFP
tara:strand:- start:137772 stop:138890 length:1119 start_codon:yes stop_codon:yes gene_type:complete